MGRIVFFHVPKCAGTTIYSHLERQLVRTRFDRAIGRHRQVIIHTNYHANQLPIKIKKAIKARVVSGHFDWNTYLRMQPSEGDYKFTFLRDPVDRLRSSYNYFCSEQGWKWINLKGKPSDYSFEDYLTAGEVTDQWAVDNVAVRMFSGNIDCDATSDGDWQELLLRAKDRILQLNFVGFQDSLDADFRTLCKNIGISSENVDRENVTRKARFVEDSPSLTTKILERTKWDQQLYEFAKSRFPVAIDTTN